MKLFEFSHFHAKKVNMAFSTGNHQPRSLMIPVGNILAWLAFRRYRFAQPTAKHGLSPDGEGVVKFQISDGCA